MAWSFSDEIHALAGYDADSTDATASGETFVVHTNRWLTEGAREVINNLPDNLQKLCTSMQSFTSAAAGSEAETLNTGKVFGVFAGSVNCRSIDNTEKYRAEDSGDVLYATSTDPAYYIESNFINVLPTSLSCKYEEVQYPTVANTDTAISVFPDEAEHLVVLYASMKALQYRMQIKSSDLPSDSDLNAVPPDTPSLASVSFSESNSLSISATAPTAISLSSVTYTSVDSDIDATAPNVSTTAVAVASTYTGSAPNYSKLSTSAATQMNAFNDYWVINDFPDSDPGALSVTAVPPDVPTLGTSSVTITGVAPSYGTPAQATNSFADVNTALDNEDIELASARINEAQLIIQDELNEFNQEQIQYQALLQKDLADAQFDNQEDARKLQKFQAEVAEYQAEVNAQVQEYSQKLSRYQLELNTVYQAWAKTESDRISAINADVQDELNDINVQNTLYQSAIQESMQEVQIANQAHIQDAQADLQVAMDNERRSQERQLQTAINDMQAIVNDNQRKISQYQAEAAHYATQVNEDVQAYTTQLQSDVQTMQGVIANNDDLVAKFSAEITHYQAEVASQIQEFTTKIQKHTADYQWLQGQYASLKADYMAGLTALKGGAVAEGGA